MTLPAAASWPAPVRERTGAAHMKAMTDTSARPSPPTSSTTERAGLTAVIQRRFSWASVHWFPTRKQSGILEPVIDADIAPALADSILASAWLAEHDTRIAAEAAAAEQVRADEATMEAERLRTGLRYLYRDWTEGWDNVDEFDQRDAYRAVSELLGPDFANAPTWREQGSEA